MSSSTKWNRRISVRVGGAAAAVALMGMLAGCGPDLSGAAAVVGNDRITDDTVTAEVNTIREGLKIDYSNALNRVVIRRLIIERLVGGLAAQNGVEVTDGDIAEFIDARTKEAGGRAQLLDFILQRFGISEAALQDWARLNIESLALAEKLAPGLTAEQQNAVVIEAANKLGEQYDIRVSPRFGVWQDLDVAPPPNDLSKPPANLQTPTTPQLVTQ